MKRLLRTLALFLALSMTLSVGALAADGDGDGPQLVMNHLDWDEEGHCFLQDSATEAENSEYDLTYNPGRSDAVIFFVLDGGEKTPVVPDGEGIEVYPVEAESISGGARHSEYYVHLALGGWEDARLTCRYKGETLTFAVTAGLPLEGFYTRPEFAQDAFLQDGFSAAGLEDNTLYFGTLRNDGEHGCHVTEAAAAGDAGRYALEPLEDGFWKITLNPDAFENDGNLFIAIDVRIRDTDRNYWNEQPGISLRGETRRLYVRWCERDEEGHFFVPSWATYDEGLQFHPDDFPIVVFYTAEGWDENGPVNPQPVPAGELAFSEGVDVYRVLETRPERVEEGDELAECYVQLDLEANDREYAVTYGEYKMTFNSYLPELAVCSAPEASFDTWVNDIRFGPFHTEEVSYIVATSTFARNGRVLKSLKLADASEDNINDLASLEEYAEGVYAVRMKSGAKLPDGGGAIMLEAAWEDEDGNTWTEDGWSVWAAQYTTMLVGEEPFVDGAGDTPDEFYAAGVDFGSVADKVSASVTMRAGEDKTVYLASAYGDEGDLADWYVYAQVPQVYAASDEALTLTPDSRDASKFTLSCDVPGEYEIYYCFYELRFMDDSGNMMPDEEFENAFAEFMSSIGARGWDLDWKTGKVVFYGGDGEALDAQCPYETVIVDGYTPNWFRVKVTVEGEARPISEIYSDITNENAWYVPAVRFVTNKGMMAGSNGQFDPNSNITGAQFVQIMYNIAGQPQAGSASFAGVTTQWYAAPVKWAAGQGLITDTGDAALDPAADITRQQLAVILYNAEGRPQVGEVDLSAFSDAGEISAWALDAVKWAVSAGVINGSGGKLDPTGATPRSQVAQLLMNYYG